MEAKIDAILLAVQPRQANKVISENEDAFEGRRTDQQFVERLRTTKFRAPAERKFLQSAVERTFCNGSEEQMIELYVDSCLRPLTNLRAQTQQHRRIA